MESTSVAVTFTDPRSFLRLPVPAAPVEHSSSLSSFSSPSPPSAVSLGLSFRTWNQAGLLLTFKLPQQAGAVWLFLSRARLFLQLQRSGGSPLELSAGQRHSGGTGGL